MSDQADESAQEESCIPEESRLRIPESGWFDGLAINHPSRLVKPKRWLEPPLTGRTTQLSQRRLNVLVRESFCRLVLSLLLFLSVPLTGLAYFVAFASNKLFLLEWGELVGVVLGCSSTSFLALILGLSSRMSIIRRYVSVFGAVLAMLLVIFIADYFGHDRSSSEFLERLFGASTFAPLTAVFLLLWPLVLRGLRWTLSYHAMPGHAGSVRDLLTMTLIVALAMSATRGNRWFNGNGIDGEDIGWIAFISCALFVLALPLLSILRMRRLSSGILISAAYVGLLVGTASVITHSSQAQQMNSNSLDQWKDVIVAWAGHTVVEIILLTLLRGGGYRIRKVSNNL